MDETRFTTWKYQHEGGGYRSPKRRIAAAAALAVAVPTAWLFPPLSFILFVAAGILFFGSTKKLHLGPRYFICGKTIVYYGNVVRLTLDEDAGRLTVQSANGRSFVLERAKFPTKARKTDKIARNKAAKFSKAAGKIIVHVLKASPEVEVAGFSRTAYQNE